LSSITYYLKYLITHLFSARISHLLVLLLLAAGLSLPLQADTKWPVTEFEIFEGQPWSSSNSVEVTLGRKLDRFKLESRSPASRPLTLALKKEMESYLHEVALKMQKLDLPAPFLEPIITREDGSQAFRIYYFDFGIGNNYDQSMYALAGYGCKNESERRRIININASKLADPNSGLITDKGYVDLAHELFHTVQRGSKFYDANCEPPLWLTEGMAEAIGTDIAIELRNAKPTQFARWGLRHYYERLAVDGNADVNPAKTYSYQTNSFWRYLAELAHYRKNLIPTERWPEAGVNSSLYGLDYKYVSRLLNKSEALPDQKELLDFLSDFLLTDAAFTMRLSNIYPVFAATFANYGLERLVDKRPAAVLHEGWITKAFGDCPVITLDATNNTAHAKLSLNRVTARCVHVNIGAINSPQTIMDISTIVQSNAIGVQLYLGTAGGKYVSQAMVKPAGAAGYIASWDPAVKAGDSFDLIFANVADKPRSTLLVDLDLQFSLPGSSNEAVAATPPPKKKKKKQKNENNQDVSDTLTEEAPQTSGSTTVSSSCSEEVPEHGCGWPASDFNGYCGPSLSIDLQTLPANVANISMMGRPTGLMNQVLNSVSGFMGPNNDTVNMPDASEFDGLHIRIGIPLPNFGDTLSYNSAVIQVEGGGWPKSGTYGPRDLLSGSQTYFSPSGRVKLEEYSALLLRGSYEAQLVALPTPITNKANFVELPIIGSLKGTFLIPRPCGKGTEQEETEVDVQRVMQDVISTYTPNNMLIPTVPKGSNPPTQSSSSSSGACDCSCEGMNKATAILDKYDEQSSGAPDAKIMSLVNCMMTCAAKYQLCEEDE
jgi:hypothetical protein